MHEIIIKGNIYDREIEVHTSHPSTWKEWERPHLMHYSEVLLKTTDEVKKKQMLSYLFLGIEHSIYLNLDPVYRLELAGLTDIFFQENYLAKNLIPSFLHDNEVYYGPADAFENCVFLEWILGDQLFNKFQQTGDIIYLDRLIAVFYRSPKKQVDKLYKGDMREPLVDDLLEGKAEAFATLPAVMKTALLTTYIGNRNTVISRFRRVFDGREDEAADNPFGWTGVLVGLAGTKFGNKAETEQTMLYDMMIHFDQNLQRLEEWEARNDDK